MFITKKNRIVVYSYLFKEGTIVVKKDFYLEKHSEEVDIPNVEVMALLKSFKSKGLVKVRHCYPQPIFRLFYWCIVSVCLYVLHIHLFHLSIRTLFHSFSFIFLNFQQETFNWNYYYYYLTKEGIDYLRQYLALPADIVPATLKVNVNKPAMPSGREQQRDDRGGRGKSFGPGGDFKPKFGNDRGGDRRGGYRGRE